jgi:hypothetical protein
VTTVLLNQQATVTLDGSGNGTASVGPIGARETWEPSLVHVSVATNTAEAQCSTYAGDGVRPSTFLDTTPSGSTGDSSSHLGVKVVCGHKVWAVWTGGDPGSVATMLITGTKEI